MGNRQIRSPRFLELLMIAAAIPLSGLSACGAGDDDGGDKASKLVKSEATALEGVRADADCAAIHDWVARNASQLPTKYADLVRYPMPYRRAIFSALDPEAKSSLWKEHFEHYRNEHPDLTAAQAAYIEKLVSSISAEFYSRLNDDPAVKKSLDQLKAEGSALFDRDSLGRLVSQLGPDPDPASGRQPLQLYGGCTCNTDDDWCSWGYDCVGGNCNDTVDGCGWWGNDPCNGLCHDV
jgi:hypothetical protein